MKIQVQHLQAGDILMGTEETVLNSPTTGIRTPSGKVELTVDREGIKRNVIWGKYTMVNIKDRSNV